MIIDRWNICQTTIHGIPSLVAKPVVHNKAMIKGICSWVMQMGREKPNDVEAVVEVFTSFCYGITNQSGVDSNNCSTKINSITTFEEPVVGLIQFLVPAVVRTKGWTWWETPKSSVRFKSTREIFSTRKVSANSRKCIRCGSLGHNKQSYVQRENALIKVPANSSDCHVVVCRMIFYSEDLFLELSLNNFCFCK